MERYIFEAYYKGVKVAEAPFIVYDEAALAEVIQETQKMLLDRMTPDPNLFIILTTIDKLLHVRRSQQQHSPVIPLLTDIVTKYTSFVFNVQGKETK